MKRMKFIGVGMVSLGFLSALINTPFAKDLNEGNPVTAVVKTQCKTHDVGNVLFTITNWGVYGSGSGFYCPGAPSAEWPKGSNVEFLFGGGLWIGAIVNNDTIVSTGVEGWTTSDETGSDYHELFPGDAPEDTIREEWSVSDQDYIAVFSDTVGFPHAPIHTPLGVEVHQRSFAWTDTVFDDFIIFDYTLYNIDTFNLQDVYVGIFFDSDIGHTSNSNRHIDDLSGFTDTLPTGDTVNIAWSKDDEGDGGMAPGVFGMKSICQDRLQTSFNWWRSHVDCDLDFGPWNPSNPNDMKLLQIQQNQCPSDTIPGTPLDDVAKYLLMSNSEIDCNQEDCPPPNPQTPPAADDTRFLFSFGVFQLSPGDSVHFSFVVGVGDGEDGLVNTLMSAEALCGVVGMQEEEKQYNEPYHLSVSQITPNPFQHHLTLHYELSATSFVSLKIYNITGRLMCTLVDEPQEPGIYRVHWDGKDGTLNPVSSGIYFLELTSGEFTSTKKIILIR